MRKTAWAISILLCLGACRKPFNIPSGSADKSILVVEGDILTGSVQPNRFLLSRLQDPGNPSSLPETGARVQVIGANGQRWNIPETSPGKYTQQLALPENLSYKLDIETSDGKRYESATLQPVATPPVDSVTWSQQGGEVRFFTHARDRTNATRYYRWRITETWERRAWYETYFDFRNGAIVTRPPGDQIFSCWKSEEGEGILVGSSEGLTEDVISYQPVHTVYKPSEKLFVRYSLLVSQLGLTREAYEFWRILRKNTELTGTLFDPQPSNLPTNLRCVNDDGRRVIGYVSAGRPTEKRIFVMHSALTGWPARDETLGCTSIEGSRAMAEEYLRGNPGYLPAYFITAGGGFGVAPAKCVDCRMTGGTNFKPPFW